MLLLKEPPARAALPPQIIAVPAGESRAIEVKAGQILRIKARQPGAVASMFAFSRINDDVYMSVHHTRVFSNSYVLQAGMRIVSNRRRALMVLGKDTSGKHDLLLPASTTAYLAEHGYAGQTGCVESVGAVIATLGLKPPKIPDPINLFMHVALHRDGCIEPLPNTTRAGDFIACRVVTDMVFIVSACCTGIAGNDTPGALELSTAEELDEL
ncbi:urea carboxylase-associated family protein [Caballeronia sp. dw_19]|uniref:urea carboxylase-associated family protein n=1 Tax=Caballeronia sp. dw_19 TaxID=2719791 RepID=UPI001BCE156D|nr:urea carboxylase-associated family protein [Caballeronia sp. dw_19]